MRLHRYPYWKDDFWWTHGAGNLVFAGFLLLWTVLACAGITALA